MKPRTFGANQMTKTRQPLPDHIERQMKLWREGFIPMPQDYINFHRDLATADLPRLLEEKGLLLHSTSLKSDGWMDGMKVVYAVVEDRRTERLFKIHWHDGNQGWMEKMPSGGSGIYV